MIRAAFVAGLVRTRNFYPEQHSYFVSQVVYPWINPGNMNPHQVTTKLFHSMHMALNFLVCGNTRLVKDSVKINGVIIEVNAASPRFHLTKSKVRFYLSSISVRIHEFGYELVQ